MDEYARMSHQQLYELAHTGDPGRLFAAGDHWHKINANMTDLHADLTQALAELAHSWQGPAADAFQQKGQAIGAKIREAAARSQNLGDGLHQMGQALGDARARMPEPPSGLERLAEHLAGGTGKGTVAGTIGGGPLGAALGAIGGGMLDDHIKSQHAEAVRVMRHLGAQYTEAIKKFEYPQADDARDKSDLGTHNLPSAPEGEISDSAGHSGARGAPFSAGPSADSGYASSGGSEPYRPHGGGTSTHLADFNPPTVSHGGNRGSGYPVSQETGYPTPPFQSGSGGGPVRPPQDSSWRPVDRPPASGGDPIGLPSRRGFGPLPGNDERRPAGGFGGEEGVFGGRATGGHGGAGPIGSDGVNGGRATTARMPASDPAAGQQPHASQDMAAAGTREGEPGMPMPPGGIGSASGEERKRGQRPSYLREDPATWDLIGPYNPPVIE